MSKLIQIAGRLQDDHLCLVVNSNDSDLNVYIDSGTGSEDFKRTSYELDIDEQIKLCKALMININKWKDQ